MRVQLAQKLAFPIATTLTVMLLWGAVRPAWADVAEIASWIESLEAEGEPDDLDDLDVVIGDSPNSSVARLISEIGFIGHKGQTPVDAWQWSTRGPPLHA